jgi:hypothetical protein
MADICNEHLNWHAVVRIAFGNACVVDKTMKGWTLNNLCLEIDPWMHPWWVDVCRCITSIGMCLPNDIWIRTQVACKGIKIIVMGELIVAPVGIPVTKKIIHHRDCVPVVVVVDPYPLDHVHDSIHGEK